MINDMKFAHVRACITPWPGTPLAGYLGRPAALGVADDLYLQVLLLEDRAGRRLLLVNAEVLGFDSAFVARLRRWLRRRDRRLAPERVVFAATHTHCGPATCQIRAGAGRRDAAYMDFFERTLKTSLSRLLAMPLVPAALSCGAGRCRLGVNRRLAVTEKTAEGLEQVRILMRPNPHGRVDDRLTLLRITARQRELLLVNYACHPTTCGGRLVSGDYPGAAARILRAAGQGRREVMFLQGAAGDIKVPCMNADKTGFVRGTTEQASAYGQVIAAAVERLLRRGLMRQRAEFTAARRSFKLPYDLDGGRLPDAGADWRAMARRRLRHDGSEGVPMEWTVWRVSRDCAILALPGEVCGELGLQSKRLVAGRFPIFVAYANGCPCYVPSDRILNEGGYEGRSNMAIYGHFWPLRRGIDRMVGHELAKLLSAMPAGWH